MFYINHKHITNYFQQLKNLYGNFWKCHDGKKEYYLKLDGYYFCDKTNAKKINKLCFIQIYKALH